MSDEHTPAPVGSLSIPGKNGGTLRNGGTNRGGYGQPPSEVRKLAREKFAKLVPKLDRLARAKGTSDRDKIRAIDVLGKYGMSTAIAVEDVKTALREQTAEIREFLPRDQADALLARLKEIWLKL
jgi:hypothetical protein